MPSNMRSDTWTRGFLRFAIIGIVFPVVAASILTVFHVAVLVAHIDLGSVGRIGVFVEVLLFYAALVVSLGGALVVCRRLWSWSS
jgi:hypothetical protein